MDNSTNNRFSPFTYTGTPAIASELQTFVCYPTANCQHNSESLHLKSANPIRNGAERCAAGAGQAYKRDAAFKEGWKQKQFKIIAPFLCSFPSLSSRSSGGYERIRQAKSRAFVECGWVCGESLSLCRRVHHFHRVIGEFRWFLDAFESFQVEQKDLFPNFRGWPEDSVLICLALDQRIPFIDPIWFSPRIPMNFALNFALFQCISMDLEMNFQ